MDWTNRSYRSVNRSGGLSRRPKAANRCQALGMRLHRAVDLVAVEGQHNCGVRSRRGERVAINFQIALVDRLAERNPGEGNEIQERPMYPSAPRSGRSASSARSAGGNLNLVGPRACNVLGALDINQRMLAHHLNRVQAHTAKERTRRIARPTRRLISRGLNSFTTASANCAAKPSPSAKAGSISIP
jgi:hypothetical protein